MPTAATDTNIEPDQTAEPHEKRERTRRIRADTHDDQDRRTAKKFFWTVLILFSIASVAGNITNGILSSANNADWPIAAAIAMVATSVHLASTHGVSALVRVRSITGIAFWIAYGASLITAILLAVGSIFLSFDALHSLALTGGIRPNRAWIVPLLIDGSITNSTISLLAMSRRTKQPNQLPDNNEEENKEQPRRLHIVTSAAPEPRRIVATITRIWRQHAEPTPPALNANTQPHTRALLRAPAPATQTPNAEPTTDRNINNAPAKTDAAFDTQPDTHTPVGSDAYEEINTIHCDGHNCDASEIADEEHPLHNATARGLRGWISTGAGQNRRDYCPRCAPAHTTVPSRDKTLVNA